jgi:hypothetical protein
MFSLPGNGPLAPTPSAPNTPTGAQYQMPQGQSGYFAPPTKYDMGTFGQARAQGPAMGTPGQDRRAAAAAAARAVAAAAAAAAAPPPAAARPPQNNAPAPGQYPGGQYPGGVGGAKSASGPAAFVGPVSQGGGRGGARAEPVDDLRFLNAGKNKTEPAFVGHMGSGQGMAGNEAFIMPQGSGQGTSVFNKMGEGNSPESIIEQKRIAAAKNTPPPQMPQSMPQPQVARPQVMPQPQVARPQAPVQTTMPQVMPQEGQAKNTPQTAQYVPPQAARPQVMPQPQVARPSAPNASRFQSALRGREEK